MLKQASNYIGVARKQDCLPVGEGNKKIGMREGEKELVLNLNRDHKNTAMIYVQIDVFLSFVH